MGSTSGRRHRRRAAERDSLALVLTLIRSGQATTRQEIERASGLGRAVVADRVATLVDKHLVIEAGLAASTGGRAPRHLHFDSAAGYVLAASLGTTTLGIGLADLSGTLLIEHHEPADVAQGAAKTVSRVIELFDWMLSEYPVPGDAWAISLALPGLVDSPAGRSDGRVTLNLVPGWGDYPVHQRLSDRFDAPVFIGNEVHMMALGELRAGHGVGREDLIFVKVGTGISAGLCADGRIHRGATGFAGDIGHVAVADGYETICRCGNRGCLEALAAGAAIAREGRAAAADGRSSYLAQLLDSGTTISAAHVGSAADRGDPFSAELIARAGRLVGESLATLVAGYNPSVVVVGGGVAQSGAIFIAAVRDGIYRRSRSLTTDNLQLVASELGKTAGLIGGASAALDDLFERDHLAAWVSHGSPRSNGEAQTKTSAATESSDVPAALASGPTLDPSVARPSLAHPRSDARSESSGLGPHGEFAAPADQLQLSGAAALIVAERKYSVALALHTGRSDWSRLQVAGIRATLQGYGSELSSVIECGFEPDQQTSAMQELLAQRPDAIISIPVGSLKSGDVHRRIADANIKLVLMDNAPVGMVARKDYASIVSADNFGNGEIAASLLSQYVPTGGRVTVVGYGVDFPVTNERELGFRKVLGEERPDVTIRRIKFSEPGAAGELMRRSLDTDDAPDAVFVVWDEPALLVSEALRVAGLSTPITTVDLGRGVAEEISRGGLIKGGGAQLPYDQGVAEATAAIMALAGDDPPPWIALPALAVTRENIEEAYRAVWHADAPPELRQRPAN